MKELRLTKYKVDGLKWHSRQSFVLKAMKEAKIDEQWEEDPMCQQLKKVKARKAMGDFDRLVYLDFVCISKTILFKYLHILYKLAINGAEVYILKN